MQFVGKILVVLQLILSVLFMAFAGVLYSTQMKWRDEALKQKDLVAKVTKEREDARSEKDRVTTDMTAKVDAADKKRAEVEGDNTTLKADVARLKKELNDATIAQTTSGEQAQIAGAEAQARDEESKNLRLLVTDMQKARDEDFAVRTKLEDQVRGLQTDLDTATKKNRELLARNSLYQQALEVAGISADPNELAGRASPAPQVEGIIEEIKPARRQGASELVEISLGSDQGLKKGHQMTVYRTGLNKPGQKPKFLAKIVIVNTTPDKAVGEVIESTRNGVIQKGDNVTTKL
jgi:hypothetical protein